MPATFVDDALTPIGTNGLIRAMALGYPKVMGAPPSAHCLARLIGQTSLETGNGLKMHKNNPGNKKKPKEWDGLFTRFKCDEIFDAPTAHRAQQLGPCVVSDWKGGPLKRVVLVPPHPWTEFVAFETPEEGMADYLTLLACSDRYAQAWSHCYAGETALFVEALGRAGYFTGPLDAYRAAVMSIEQKVLPACTALMEGAEHGGITDEERAHIEQLVAVTLWDGIHMLGRSPDHLLAA